MAEHWLRTLRKPESHQFPDGGVCLHQQCAHCLEVYRPCQKEQWSDECTHPQLFEGEK